VCARSVSKMAESNRRVVAAIALSHGAVAVPGRWRPCSGVCPHPVPTMTTLEPRVPRVDLLVRDD
jgi:hypothetical protein